LAFDKQIVFLYFSRHWFVPTGHFFHIGNVKTEEVKKNYFLCIALHLAIVLSVLLQPACVMKKNRANRFSVSLESLNLNTLTLASELDS
jgi:hypothetical protein